MITFAVEGGIANQMRSLRIEPSGTAEAEVNRRSVGGALGAARVAQITAALRSSDLFNGDGTNVRTFAAPPGGADLQRYEIGYHGVRIVAFDTTVPQGLIEAIHLLDQALRELQQ